METMLENLDTKQINMHSSFFYKNLLSFHFTTILIFGVFTLNLLSAQGIAINENGDPPHASAALEINVEHKGFLPPRMTELERNAISSPAEGLVIFNTDAKCLEFFVDGSWVNLCNNVVPGIGTNFSVEIFKDVGSHTWEVPVDVTSVDVLIIAGGGGGRGKNEGNIMSGPGGGAGGILQLLNYSVTPGDIISLTVGAGGAGGQGGVGGTPSSQPIKGNDSSFDGNIAFGGGIGGGANSSIITDMNGGSGGGASFSNTQGIPPGSGTPGFGVPGQGNNGGRLTGNTNGHRAGGGGGFSEPGQDGGNQSGGKGGDGLVLGNSIWIVAIPFGAPPAVGGGGSAGTYSQGGTLAGAPVSIGGGGKGGDGNPNNPENGGHGLPNTGGGGGGAGGGNAASGNAANGGNGGSGMVIIRWLN
jgi:hypothetical protein